MGGKPKSQCVFAVDHSQPYHQHGYVCDLHNRKLEMLSLNQADDSRHTLGYFVLPLDISLLFIL